MAQVAVVTRVEIEMPSSGSPDIARVLAGMHEAGFGSEAYLELLRLLTAELGIAGAACIIFNKTLRRVDWAGFAGLSAALESKYVDHYAALDPFAPVVAVAPTWIKMSECLSRPLLAKSEWYNEFVLTCGISDAVGVRLVSQGAHCAMLGLHQQIGHSFGDATIPVLTHLRQPLASATRQHMDWLFGPADTCGR